VTGRAKPIGQVVALACVAGLLALLVWKLTHQQHAPPVGSPAPAFSLARLDGPGSVSLASLRGHPVVLNFWASWCLSCRDEHQILSETAKTYAGKPVHFVGVLYNDEPANGTQWIEQMGGQSYPSVNDPGARTAINYGLYGVPETYFLDVNGRIAYKATGPVNERLIRHVVDSLMTAGAK
jgi:cytochrome c biogenesis protein CcmG/thiol:disulfide interchange protein DsbE